MPNSISPHVPELPSLLKKFPVINPSEPINLSFARKHLGLIKCFDDKTLEALCDEPCADPLLSEYILAEIIFRLWLFRQASEERKNHLLTLATRIWEDKRRLRQPAFPVVRAWLNRNGAHRELSLPPELRGQGNDFLGNLLQRRIDTWKSADGVIPFISLHPKFCRTLIFPFNLRPTTDKDEKGKVLNSEGRSIDGLCDSMRGALAAYNSLYHAVPPENNSRYFDAWLPDIPPSFSDYIRGASASFSFLMAFCNIELDNPVSVFEACATGVLSPSDGYPEVNRQEPTDLEAKIKALREIGIKQIYAIGPSDFTHAMEGLVICHTKDNLQAACQSWQVLARRRIILEKPNPHKVEAELAEIELALRQGSVSLPETKKLLLELLSSLGNSSDYLTAEIRSEVQMTLATVECHRGDSAASEAWIAQAYRNDSALGEYSRTKALIRQAINLKDFGRYAEAAQLVDDKAVIIAGSHLRGSEKLKLQLDLHGTLGQVYTLSGLRDPNFQTKAAIELNRACEIARQLDKFGGKVQELPQDLCYLYQWHAFFDRRGCEEVWKEFETVTRANHLSHQFMKRLRWQAAWLAQIEGDSTPIDWRTFEDDLPNLADSSSTRWLHFLSRKYRGTLRCEAGQLENAKADFAEAAKLMEESLSAPILLFIGITVALEAYRCLLPHDPKAARAHLTRGKTFLTSHLKDIYHADYPSFLSCIENPDPDSIAAILRTFPY
jgi:hypothetical protein